MYVFESLIKLFSKNRIIFGMIRKSKCGKNSKISRQKGVKKIEINNNKFSLKYKSLKEETNQKFLIYKNELADNYKEENWLLDI